MQQFRFLHQRRLIGRASLETLVKVPPSLPKVIRQAVAVASGQIPAFVKQQPWQLGVRVVGAAQAKGANQQFRAKDYTPDVLTFPLWQAGYAGDILLCWPVLKAAAVAQGKPWQAHLQHLVVHSLLHLAGEDHQTPAQAKKMEAKELTLLADLGWPNPYLIG